MIATTFLGASGTPFSVWIFLKYKKSNSGIPPSDYTITASFNQWTECWYLLFYNVWFFNSRLLKFFGCVRDSSPVLSRIWRFLVLLVETWRFDTWFSARYNQQSWTIQIRSWLSITKNIACKIVLNSQTPQNVKIKCLIHQKIYYPIIYNHVLNTFKSGNISKLVPQIGLSYFTSILGVSKKMFAIVVYWLAE